MSAVPAGPCHQKHDLEDGGEVERHAYYHFKDEREQHDDSVFLVHSLPWDVRRGDRDDPRLRPTQSPLMLYHGTKMDHLIEMTSLNTSKHHNRAHTTSLVKLQFYQAF